MQIRFMCDAMLGTLAKNLRLFGFDTQFVGELEKEMFGNPTDESFESLPDVKILEMAIESNRIVLTKDEGFALRDPERVVLIEGATDREHFAFLKEKMNLTFIFDQAKSRCYKCNQIVESVSKAEIKDKVKENTYLSFNEFYQCPSCSQVFWMGSHFQNEENGILSKFKGLLD